MYITRQTNGIRGAVLFYRAFQLPLFRERYCRIRFLVLKRWQKLDRGNSNDVLHEDYSESHFQSYTSHKLRINHLLKLVKNNLNQKSQSTVLSIGPRFESELYGLRGLGLKWSQISAIDTFSYSPRIRVGNMHDLDFPDCHFDLVLAGFVLAYSADPIKAMTELSRVLKPGGRVILTWELPRGVKFTSPQSFSLYRKDSLLMESSRKLKDFDIFTLGGRSLEVHGFELSSLHPKENPSFVSIVFSKTQDSIHK